MLRRPVGTPTRQLMTLVPVVGTHRRPVGPPTRQFLMLVPVVGTHRRPVGPPARQRLTLVPVEWTHRRPVGPPARQRLTLVSAVGMHRRPVGPPARQFLMLVPVVGTHRRPVGPPTRQRLTRRRRMTGDFPPRTSRRVTGRSPGARTGEVLWAGIPDGTKGVAWLFSSGTSGINEVSAAVTPHSPLPTHSHRRSERPAQRLTPQFSIP